MHGGGVFSTLTGAVSTDYPRSARNDLEPGILIKTAEAGQVLQHFAPGAGNPEHAMLCNPAFS